MSLKSKAPLVKGCSPIGALGGQCFPVVGVYSVMENPRCGTAQAPGPGTGWTYSKILQNSEGLDDSTDDGSMQ